MIQTRFKFLVALGISVIMLFCFSLMAFAATGDGDIVRQFVVDDPHHGEYCTEDAATVREFGLGTAYGPIMTNGVIDPLFANGGYLFGPTDKAKLKIYAIAVDFTDAVGDMQVPFGRHRNVVKSAYGGTVFDFSDPQIHFETQFKGTTALKANPKFTWLGTNAQEFKGIAQILEEQSMGKMKVDVELLNERLAKVQGIDTSKERVPWFHINGPIFAYSDAGPADCEDYRQFARLYQAAIYAAVEQLEAAGLTGDNIGEGSNIEDIGFIYVITPFNAFGYRLGFQGGGGIMSSYSFNEQALTQRDSEYRHVPGVLTPGGRMVGSGVFGMKGIVNPGNSNNISPNIGNALHELTHGLGMFDDYSYGGLGTNAGEATASGSGNWGVMGSNMSSVSPDPPVWRKFRMGWIDDEEIKVILPGDESIDIFLRALGSVPGKDGGVYSNDPSIKTRMIVIPKEYRTRDTFGVVWNNGWNPYKTNYNWYDWFTNIYVGGETYALKSFPTFYTLESRRALGADGNPLGRYTGLPEGRRGVVVDYIANPTWETGHGAGGFKVMTGDNGLKEGAVWSDPNIGLTVSILEAGDYYDKVRIEYTGSATNGAQHVYQGLLQASDNYVTNGDEFTVDFNLTTLGMPAPNDSVNNANTLNTVMRVATPLGVPGGISGFTMEVVFDAAKFEYVSAGATPFTCTVDTVNAVTGILLVKGTGGKMVDKDTILSLNFNTKAGATLGESTVSAKITDVTLFNWRGEPVVKGDPGFDDVGAFGDGTLAALYNTTANNTYTPNITSTGGNVTVGNIATYTICGTIVCDTPGPVPGSFIGVESEVTLYNSSNVAIATAKSNWDGNYTIKGVPAGIGYYVKAEKSKYSIGQTAPFAVSGKTVVAELKLDRQTYPVSGTIYGGVSSDGSDKAPLADVDVYVISIGNGYRVLGGPAKTDAQGRYTVYATTDSANSNFAGIAVKAEGNAAKYGTQLTLFEKDDIFGKQVGDIDLNMGTQTHLILDDWVYPSNTARLGAEGTFAFSLGGPDSQIVTGRDLTLTETQDVHIRTVTKSPDIYYQLRNLSDGSAVGDKVKSVGTANGDDMIRNVPKGQYYIELTREGYVSLNTMPIAVDTTRVLLRDGQTTNTIDMNTRLGANVVSGTVVNAITGEPVQGVKIEFVSWSNTGGKGNPVYSGAGGEFAYDVLTDDKDIFFSKEGYTTKAVNIASGGASDLVIELAPYDFTIWMETKNNLLEMGDILSVDVMLKGNINYTLAETKIAYDTDLFEYMGYENLSGWMTQIQKEAPNLITTRNVAAINMNVGAPCTEAIRLITLKFKVKDSLSEERIETALYFDTANVYSTSNVSVPTLAPKEELPLILFGPAFVKGLYKNMELYPEWIADGDTQPIFTYADAITEIVWVEVPCDTDRDGLRDRVSVWVMRPKTLDGFKCPVMLEHSPYHHSTVGYNAVSGSAFDGEYAYMREPFRYRHNWPIHRDPEDPAFADTTHLTYDDIKYTGIESFNWPWIDAPFETGSWYTGTKYGNVPGATVSAKDAKGNIIYDTPDSYSWSPSTAYRYYLPRGYALVYLGARDGDGITNTLHVEEVLSAMAVINWLNGEAKGYTSRRGNVEVKADWANGNVGMTGTSYPADTAFATVVSGVEGLKAVMPQCNGLNWYDYYRYAGTVNSPGGYGGEDLNLHASYNFSRWRADGISNGQIPPANGQWFGKSIQDVFFETQKHMMEKQDNITGNYNAEWELRNFGRHADRINEDVGLLMTTGFMDWNSQPKLSMANWTVLLDKCPATFKEFASISSHAGQSSAVIHGKSIVEWWHFWMDHFLLGLDNGVVEALPDLTVINTKTGAVEGYNINKEAQPGDADYLVPGGIVPGAKNQKLYLVPAKEGKAGRLSYEVPAAAVDHFNDMDVLDMLQADYPGAPALTASQKTINLSGDGNYRVTTGSGTGSQAQFCEGRAVGVNRTYNFGISGTEAADIKAINEQIFAAVDKPIEGRLMYLSEPLTDDVRLSGTGVVYLSAAPDRAVGNISAAVVEVGRVRNMESSRSNAWGMSVGTGNNLLQQAYALPLGGGQGSMNVGTFRNPSEVGAFMNYKYVTVGYADIMNPNYSGKVWFEVPEQNYIPDFYFQTTKIVPGKYYPYTIELDPYDYIFREGSRIGIMIFGTDPDYSLLYDKDGIAEFDIAIGAGSYAMLPLTKALSLEAAADEEEEEEEGGGEETVLGDKEEAIAAYDEAHAAFCAYYDTASWTFKKELFVGYTYGSVLQAESVMGAAGGAHAGLLAAHGKLEAGRFDISDDLDAINEGTYILGKAIADMEAVLVKE